MTQHYAVAVPLVRRKRRNRRVRFPLATAAREHHRAQTQRKRAGSCAALEAPAPCTTLNIVTAVGDCHVLKFARYFAARGDARSSKRHAAPRNPLQWSPTGRHSAARFRWNAGGRQGLCFADLRCGVGVRRRFGGSAQAMRAREMAAAAARAIGRAFMSFNRAPTLGFHPSQAVVCGIFPHSC